MIIYLVILYLMIYSFIGWTMESVYVSVKLKKPVNRGFLNGPACPIYGVGALILITFLAPVSHNLPLLFVLGLVLTSLLEYAVGFAMEKLFHAKWWDYSDQKFNINGRVSLKNSIYWGLLSALLMTQVHPRITQLVDMIPKNIAMFTAWASFAMLLVDTAVTIPTVITLNTRLASLHKVYEELNTRLNLSPVISEKIYALHERYNEMVSKRNILHWRILSAFPNIRSIKYSDILNQLKNRMNLK